MKSVFICKKLTDFSNVYFAFCFIKVKKNTFQTSKTKELKLRKLNVTFLCHYRQRDASIIHWLQWFYTKPLLNHTKTIPKLLKKIQQFQRESSHLDLHKFTKFTEFYPKDYTSSKACGRCWEKRNKQNALTMLISLPVYRTSFTVFTGRYTAEFKQMCMNASLKEVVSVTHWTIKLWVMGAGGYDGQHLQKELNYYVQPRLLFNFQACLLVC